MSGISAASALTMSGCGMGGGSGSDVGFNELTRAEPAQLSSLCTDFFGDEESLSERLGMTVYAHETDEGQCRYESSSGLSVSLGVSEAKPDGATVYARGSTYYASLAVGGEDVPAGLFDSDTTEKLTEWLEGRANAVKDDHAEWLASLPAAEPGYASADGFAFDDSYDSAAKTLDGTLNTPAAVVHVASVTTPPYLLLADKPTRAGDASKFIVSDVTITQPEEQEVSPTYGLTYDGKPAGAATEQALESLIAATGTQLALAVPTEVKDVAITVKVGETTQAVSLLTGKVLDEGQSERLGTQVSSVSTADFTEPVITRPDGDTVSWGFGYTADYARDGNWSLTPWTAKNGWAPQGKAYFVLALTPETPEAALPLTAKDATATINGESYSATSFDPRDYTFTFLVPEGATRVRVTVSMSIDTSQLETDGYYPEWGPGYKVTTAERLTWTIDPNNVPDEESDWDSSSGG
ncbi:hypothetical protein [Motilibacter aurantiacus]|uniref:hypothetical protein n=1 Tax=Motilibacter aurantiacus TaxID=2714955 RepID=UPI0014081F33|nr:hypothetical protein [Motilibacter aurantiacus]NHC45310.1 hypothetical protein [Motilibacter aurantiacus]